MAGARSDDEARLLLRHEMEVLEAIDGVSSVSESPRNGPAFNDMAIILRWWDADRNVWQVPSAIPSAAPHALSESLPAQQTCVTISHHRMRARKQALPRL